MGGDAATVVLSDGPTAGEPGRLCQTPSLVPFPASEFRCQRRRLMPRGHGRPILGPACSVSMDQEKACGFFLSILSFPRCRQFGGKRESEPLYLRKAPAASGVCARRRTAAVVCGWPSLAARSRRGRRGASPLRGYPNAAAMNAGDRTRNWVSGNGTSPGSARRRANPTDRE